MYTDTNKHACTMVLYITIRFSIHSNAGLGWNPMERNKEISEYSSNGDISTAHLIWMFAGLQLKGNLLYCLAEKECYLELHVVTDVSFSPNIHMNRM